MFGKQVSALAIFSAEGEKFSVGNEHFMGNWLAAKKNPFDEAESTFFRCWGTKSDQLPPFEGFQYYEYVFPISLCTVKRITFAAAKGQNIFFN